MHRNDEDDDNAMHVDGEKESRGAADGDGSV